MSKNSTVITILVLIALCAVVFGFYEKKQSAKLEQELNAASIYNLNQVIKTDKLSISVLRAEERNSLGGNEIMQINPPAGNIYYIVNWMYVNITNAPINMTAAPQIALMNNNGKKIVPNVESQKVFLQELKLEQNANVEELKPQMPILDGDVFVVNKDEFSKGDWYIVFSSEGKEYKMPIKK